MRFTPEQTIAIERRRGELLIDAGAGSGKTSVLVERFARTVSEDGLSAGQILTITFTEKAAAELRERIRRRLQEFGDETAARATEGAWISTIHAFCARLLRTHAVDAGLDPEFTVLDEREAGELRRAAFDAALKLTAATDGGGELISAHGPERLAAAITSLYAELRARGSLEPTLPAAPPAPAELDVRGACLLVQGLADEVLGELDAIRAPGRRVLEATAVLEQVQPVLESGRPWPGELEALKLGNGAKALRTEACEEYRDALADLQEMVCDGAAGLARDAIDALLRAYGERYTALKRQRAAVDFSDLELLARELLRDQEIGERYRTRFGRVMVDEMQDTNHVQLELIDLVTNTDLVMVGDAQQSIYGFRHADVELFAERGRRLERIGARTSLQTNFRSRTEILTAVNAAFGRALGDDYRSLAPGRVDPPAAEPLVELLIADRDGSAVDEDPLLEQLAAPWRLAEARSLAARVGELIAAGQASPRDVVVLLRATTDMHVYEQALEAAGIPTYVIGGRGYWSHPQVIELVAYLRALANPLDTEALYTVYSSPLCGLSLDGLVLVAAGALEDVPHSDRVRLQAFQSWFTAERRAAAWSGVEQLLDRALAHNGYEQSLASRSDARRRLANVRKLLRLAREWQAQHGSDLAGFVRLLRSRTDGADSARESEAPVEGESLNAVRLMTIHRSKGLEFPVVCVADLGRQVLPRAGELVKVGHDGRRLGLRLRRAGHAHRVSALDYDELRAEERERELAEERRLFYVAMTRARERLILSGAARLQGWAERNRLAPIGWIGTAMVPDIGERAATAATDPVQGDEGPGYITGDGVRLRFVGATTAGGGSLRAPAAPATARPAPVMAPALSTTWQAPVDLVASHPLQPRISTLSYTALALHDQCGYRFYVQRVLGLPELPTPALGDESAQAGGVQNAPTRGGLSAAQRGTLVHQLLASIDVRNPSLREAMPADVRAQLVGLVGSTTFGRLAALRGIRREQRFAFPVGETLITGVFDVIAQERQGQLLVLDYKSDRLNGADPEAVVSDRYLAQRAIYALAALKLGAEGVEVLHLFLEAPERPAAERFSASDVPVLEAEVGRRIAAINAQGEDSFRVTETPGRRICDGCPAQGGLCSHPLELTTR